MINSKLDDNEINPFSKTLEAYFIQNARRVRPVLYGYGFDYGYGLVPTVPSILKVQF